MGPPQAGIWGLVVARTLCSLRDVEATVHAHILSTGITNLAWQVGTGTRCSGTQVKYARTRTQGNRGHRSHSRLHGEQRTQALRGHWKVQHRKSATVISEGLGVVRISSVPRLSKPGGTRLRLADHSDGAPLLAALHTEGPLLAGGWWRQEQVAEVGPWHLACVTGVVGECLAA